MLWNLLTAGIFGTDYYIKKKINTSEKKDLKEKCLGGRPYYLFKNNVYIQKLFFYYFCI